MQGEPPVRTEIAQRLELRLVMLVREKLEHARAGREVGRMEQLEADQDCRRDQKAEPQQDPLDRGVCIDPCQMPLPRLLRDGTPKMKRAPQGARLAPGW